MRYNKLCPLHESGWETQQYMREDDLVCRKHYFKLPEPMRKLCWGDEDDWERVLNWLKENAL